MVLFLRLIMPKRGVTEYCSLLPLQAKSGNNVKGSRVGPPGHFRLGNAGGRPLVAMQRVRHKPFISPEIENDEPSRMSLFKTILPLRGDSPDITAPIIVRQWKKEGLQIKY